MPSRLAALLAFTILLAPATARAAAPANDNRADARTLTAGSDVTGTTVEATREASEPPNCPTNGGPSVWYRYESPRVGFARLLLETKDKLDATLAVYDVERSTISRIGCADTRRGTIFSSTRLEKGTYLLRVTERQGSGSGAFRLRFSGTLEEPTSTGTPLPASGTRSGALNALTRPFVRVSRKLRAGESYRVRTAIGKGGRCFASARLIDPHGQQRRFLGCRDYTVVTPEPEDSGRWVLALTDNGFSPDDQPFRVSIARTGPDDLAPGRFIGGFGVARGSVSGRSADAEDVYRFDVTDRAEITLRLRSKGAMSLQLRTESGRRVTSARVDDDTGQIRTRLRPGRFFVIVSAARSAGGRYKLSRLTRVITSTTVTWDGSASSEKAPGSSSTVQVSVSPVATGRAKVTVERFDPQFGWRFYKRRTVSISGGRGSYTVPTQAIGRYRARAEYLGLRTFSPSQTRRSAFLRVVAPLRQ